MSNFCIWSLQRLFWSCLGNVPREHSSGMFLVNVLRGMFFGDSSAVKETPPPHPRTRNVFFVMIFLRGHLCGRKAGICISPAWGSCRWLSFLVRSHTSVQIHFRGLCHWAGGLTARQAAEPPSRRAAKRANARKLNPPRPRRAQGPF